MTDAPRTRRDRWWADDRGSVAAELALITPLLTTLLVFVAVVVHRGVDARLRIDDAAHQAARAASVERGPVTAHAAARTTATRALADAGVACRAVTIDVDTGGVRPGGTVVVTLSCRVDFGDAPVLGLPGGRTLTSRAVEPVDTWRSAPTGSGT